MIKNKYMACKIGIIGGSGLDDPQLVQNCNSIEVQTPFGVPSSKLTMERIGNNEVVIIARHGKDHSIMPSKVNYRANIWALKDQGCSYILATTACGSLKEEIKPGDFVFPDQFIDWTKQRALTFFEDKVIHTPMAEPFDATLRGKLIETAKELNVAFHNHGVVITIEGPRFSTRAESLMFRLLNADIINMSTVPEVILANELKIPYQTIAMSTDYDCWRKGEESVTWEIILKRMKENADKVKEIIVKTVSNI